MYLSPKTIRSALDRAKQLTRDETGDRYLDCGIKLWTVRQDQANGRIVLPGKPPLSPVGPARFFGGKIDTVSQRVVGQPDSWLQWYVGEEQARILFGDYDETRILHYSAEGAGKTENLAIWVITNALACARLGVRGFAGVTAPTRARLKTALDAIRRRVPTDTPTEPRRGAWATYYSTESELRFCWGVTLQLRATKARSKNEGATVQGYTWMFSADDELQDTAANGADPDIEARLRGARVSRRYCTATAKDSPGWRTFRDEKTASQDWRIERTRFDGNPFVWPEHWERMKRNMSEREWKRRGLALDVGPERQLYHTWDREQHLMPWPMLGAKDVTSKVLGSRYGILVGHDPGKIQDVSVFLKAVKFRGEERHRWVVVGELTTKRTTSEEHFAELLRVLRETWGMNLPEEQQALVRCDPYGTRGEEKPDRSVYLTAKKMGLDMRSAAYKNGQGSGHISKEARIEMLNRLLRSAAGDTWLYVACSDKRKPLAEKVVNSLEMSERDESGRAEAHTKWDKSKDLSDHTCALGYALWSLEKVKSIRIGTGAALA